MCSTTEDLQGLRWTKNVNATEGDWAYKHDEVSYLSLIPEFMLQLKTTALENANKPRKEDLILLRQRARVTHIVKVLGDVEYGDNPFSDFAICRRVQVMWMALTPWWDKAPHQKEVFGFDPELQGGKVIYLENIKALQEYFCDQGGLTAFRERVKEKLTLRI